jgi:hypothetical protein
MNIEIKERFMEAWGKHFPGNELPIACFYSNELNNVEFPNAPKPNKKGFTCIFSQIAPVRKGRPRAFNKENLGCFGSFLPFGFDISVSEDVKNYICNVERVKKSYDHVDSMYVHRPPKKAPGKYLVFKRWDTLEEHDDPQVVFFFGNPNVIAGLHGLANFDSMTPYDVIAPFGTGCDSIVGFPMHELESEMPKAVLGALDPSVRIRFKPDILTFSAPWPKFLSMLENMDESFLVTDSWSKVKSRFSRVK